MIKSSIAVNSLSGAMVPIVKVAITFIMAPLIVRSLGNYDYGVWEIVFAVVGYMGVLDLGLLPAIVRGVSRHHTLDEQDELQRIFSTSLAYFVPLGIILGCGMLAAVYLYPGLFGEVISENHLKYTLFFCLIAVQVLFSFVGGLFDGYLEGLQCYTLRNSLTIVFSIVGAIVLYPLLKGGGGLLSLALVNVAGFLLKHMVYGVILMLPAYGGLRFRFRNISFATLKNLFNFGVKSFIYAVSLRVTHMTDALVIGAVLGPVAVTYYVIPANLLNHARNLISAGTRNFMPLFSEMDATSQQGKSKELFFDASRILLGIIVPLLAGIFLLGPSFISYWMGPEYAEQGRWVLYIMAAACTVQWMNPIGNRYLTGLGRHGIMARIGVYNAFLNFGFSIILVYLIGKEGVALGTFLPVIMLEPWLLHQTCLIGDTNIWQYARQAMIPLLKPMIIHVSALWAMLHFWPPSSLAMVMLIGAVSVALYLPVFILMVLRPAERIYFSKRRRKAVCMTK